MEVMARYKRAHRGIHTWETLQNNKGAVGFNRAQLRDTV